MSECDGYCLLVAGYRWTPSFSRRRWTTVLWTTSIVAVVVVVVVMATRSVSEPRILRNNLQPFDARDCCHMGTARPIKPLVTVSS